MVIPSVLSLSYSIFKCFLQYNTWPKLVFSKFNFKRIKLKWFHLCMQSIITINMVIFVLGCEHPYISMQYVTYFGEGRQSFIENQTMENKAVTG